MSEEKKQEEKIEETVETPVVAAQVEVESTDDKPEESQAKKTVFGAKRKLAGKGRGPRRDKPKDEFDQRILDVARVTRVMKGGKRMSFRVCIAIGDHKGKVGVALGKGADVTLAINKAVNRAKKDMVDVNMVNDTIPHEVYNANGAAKILFKPARRGRGVIAGGVVRVILELAGVKNVTSKILGTNNKINNAACTIEALRKLKAVAGRDADKKEKKEAKKEVKKDVKKEVKTENKKEIKK